MGNTNDWQSRKPAGLNTRHPKSRAEARLLKVKIYYPQQGCKIDGHNAGFFTSSGKCVDCSRLYAREYNKNRRFRGYESKKADPNAFNHRGAPLVDITPEEIAWIDLTPQPRAGHSSHSD